MNYGKKADTSKSKIGFSYAETHYAVQKKYYLPMQLQEMCKHIYIAVLQTFTGYFMIIKIIFND